MISSLVPLLTGIIGKSLDKLIPDEVEREKIKRQVELEILAMDQVKLEQSASLIRAEIQGESWLQRTWRPILMLWFAFLVGLHWLGMTPENLTPEAVDGLLDIVMVSVGGFVIGRSTEKSIRTWSAHKQPTSVSGPGGLY